MKLLLDTHVFLWWVGDDARLSRPARDAISSPENQIFLSVASAWEMAVKEQLGRLKVESELDRFLTEQLQRNAMTVLPIGLAHALRLRTLPLHHRDPFDRMLVAQAQVEDLALVTADTLIRQYDVRICW